MRASARGIMVKKSNDCKKQHVLRRICFCLLSLCLGKANFFVKKSGWFWAAYRHLPMDRTVACRRTAFSTVPEASRPSTHPTARSFPRGMFRFRFLFFFFFFSSSHDDDDDDETKVCSRYKKKDPHQRRRHKEKLSSSQQKRAQEQKNAFVVIDTIVTRARAVVVVVVLLLLSPPPFSSSCDEM